MGPRPQDAGNAFVDPPCLAVVGAGSMGAAIVRGVVSAGLDPGRIVVAEVDGARREALASATGVRAVADANDALAFLARMDRPEAPGQVLLAIKPQGLAALARSVHEENARRERVAISILAGTRGERIRAAFPGWRVVRAMPTLAAGVGRSVTAICPSAGALPGDEAFAGAVFSAVGRLVVNVPEDRMDAFTALAGSGPAYAFYLGEAMVEAGVAMGLARGESERIVREVLAGAGVLVERDPRPLAALRESVTSKGGTTEAAIAVLEASGVREAIVRAIRAGEARGRALGASG